MTDSGWHEINSRERKVSDSSNATSATRRGYRLMPSANIVKDARGVKPRFYQSTCGKIMRRIQRSRRRRTTRSRTMRVGVRHVEKEFANQFLSMKASLNIF
tara:strand:+ start:496 stop:798 length:303 start_codon:yes stop_codon:yes gene_type:complete